MDAAIDSVLADLVSRGVESRESGQKVVCLAARQGVAVAIAGAEDWRSEFQSPRSLQGSRRSRCDHRNQQSKVEHRRPQATALTLCDSVVGLSGLVVGTSSMRTATHPCTDLASRAHKHDPGCAGRRSRFCRRRRKHLIRQNELPACHLTGASSIWINNNSGFEFQQNDESAQSDRLDKLLRARFGLAPHGASNGDEQAGTDESGDEIT